MELIPPESNILSFYFHFLFKFELTEFLSDAPFQEINSHKTFPLILMFFRKICAMVNRDMITNKSFVPDTTTIMAAFNEKISEV
jgi:hypothetical protein